MAGSGFVAMCYAFLNGRGIDTKGMSPKEAIDRYNELNGSAEKQEKEEEKDERKKLASRYTSESSAGKERKEKGSENPVSKEKQGGESDAEIFETDSKTFRKNLVRAKESTPEEDRWRVDVHEEAEYGKDKRFTTKGGSCIAVEPNGNIISLCKQSGDIVHGGDLVKHAVLNGGNRLDAYSGLYVFYLKQGFEPVSWVEFDENFAPEGWDVKRDGKEPILFYKYTGKIPKTPEDLEPLEAFQKRVPRSKDYDTAMAMRDKEIKK